MTVRFAMDKYIVSPKKSFREDEVWKDQLASIPGITVANPGGRRLRVEATHEAIQEARSKLATYCHIEPLIKHERLEH